MLEIKITGVDEALSKLTEYKRTFPDKLKEVVELLMYEGYQVAVAMFNEAIYEGTNDVTVDLPFWEDDRLMLYAHGEAVAFIEFGTGTIASPYPTTIEGKTIDPYSKLHLSRRGEYGKKHGENPPWYYPAERGLGNKGRPKRISEGNYSDKWAIAYGNPPARAMFSATETVANKERALEIAREVFKV